MKKTVDIVVTYNRKQLLEENINSLLSQTYEHHNIMIIDNASTDGTKEMIEKINNKKIIYYNTGKNLGGAGGFAFGLRKALEMNYDYAWVMDDDSIPKKDSLESLIKKAKILNDNFSYIASLVYWTDNKLFPMNIPSFNITNKNIDEIEKIKFNNLLPIESSSFVGCFINLECAKSVGIPIKEFFIYGDDVEYTLRLRKKNIAYLDLDSVIIHKAPNNLGANIVTADSSRLDRFYYQSRNAMYIAKKYYKFFGLGQLKRVLNKTKLILLQSKNFKLKRLYLLYKGTLKGIFFNPKIEIIK